SGRGPSSSGAGRPAPRRSRRRGARLGPPPRFAAGSPGAASWCREPRRPASRGAPSSSNTGSRPRSPPRPSIRRLRGRRKPAFPRWPGPGPRLPAARCSPVPGGPFRLRSRWDPGPRARPALKFSSSSPLLRSLGYTHRERRNMRRSPLAALLICVLACAAARAAEPAATLALVGGRIIDGYEGKPIEDGVILISGDRITAVGTRSQVAVPPGTPVIDTRGMSVLPGLADMHVHLMILGHGDYEHWDTTYAKRFRSEIMPAAAKQLLVSGVTFARELGAPLEDILDVKRRIETG